jgi:excisionase family DNA binding protein
MPARKNDAHEFLTDVQLCALLHVVTRTTARWRKKNGLPYIRAGGRRILYRRADVDRWLAQQTFNRAAELEEGAA